MKAEILNTPGPWSERLAVNAGRAIYHQWEQLEGSGCILNFRIAAVEAAGLRRGWFFADSDAYKWLEAAVRIQAASVEPRLAGLVEDFIALLGRAQEADGYLFTYNQIHFPGVRWQNLQIEHELYCHGHLIEAGVAHAQVSGRTDLLEIACRAADRIVEDFRGKGPTYTPGHEEIEIALLRLHQICPGRGQYLELASQFIEQRGRSRGFVLSLLQQNARVNRRGREVRRQAQAALHDHPDWTPAPLPPGNEARKPANIALRWYANLASGRYFQQHAPVREQHTPTGHVVRFAYLETAAALFARLHGDRSLLPALEHAWDHMVSRRMYLTGGVGSLPVLEGFGRDYELDPEFAYAETCAALGCLFWNWEMALLSGEAKYSDLFEWQLYNAAAVGMGLDGNSYLYNNPLASRGGIRRRPWYAIPCCPSNLSRTLAGLDRYLYSGAPGTLSVHQYIDSELLDEDSSLRLKQESALPWEGSAGLEILDGRLETLLLRRPGWAGTTDLAVNGEPVGPQTCILHGGAAPGEAAASGYDPRLAAFIELRRAWAPGDRVELRFSMPITLRRPHPKVRGLAGMAAVTRGPLVYCLESTDNPGVDLFAVRLDPASLKAVFDPHLLGGIVKILGASSDGASITFIPYALWGNRGQSQMNVWIYAGGR